MAGSPTRLRSAEIRLVSIMSTSQVSKAAQGWELHVWHSTGHADQAVWPTVVEPNPEPPSSWNEALGFGVSKIVENRRPGVCRALKGLVGLSVVVIVVAPGGGYPVASALPSPQSGPGMRTEVVAAFRHLVGPPESARQLFPYVDAVDGPLAAAIAGGAAQTRSDDSALLSNGTSSVSTIKVVASGVATVDFGITDQGSGGYLQRFEGNVVLADGRWKVSWATVCMLVEAESYVCPNPPTALPGAVPLPRSLSGEVETAHQEPDLLRPQALAIEPDGDLLIVDSDRDQILRWQSDGHLSIFAGTGQPGLAGVGGPAVDARLPNYFGSQLAVAKDGSVYITGGNVCGLLVVTPSGRLRRGLTSLCGISGVTISALGAIYVADGGAVYRVSASGALVELARNSYPAPTRANSGVPAAVGFSPALLAFQSNGDLDIYSDGPRAIWRLTPKGKLTDVGIEYADGMDTAPDGSVLVAGHGGRIDRVTASKIVSDIDLLSARIAGYGVPGMRGGFQPDGIAVAPDGTVFVDTFSGNGWTDATSVAEIPRGGQPHQIAINTPVLGTLPGTSAPGFAASVYPAPVVASGSDLASCPSPDGLQSFGPAAIVAAKRVAAQFNAYTSSFWGDLHSSDRSWWKSVFGEWTGGAYDNDTHTVESEGPATADTFAPAVATACGRALVRDSEVVVEGPSSYSFQVTHLFMLDRDGHPLVYFQAA
jgi:sugar lactone lactonase YvrE